MKYGSENSVGDVCACCNIIGTEMVFQARIASVIGQLLSAHLAHNSLFQHPLRLPFLKSKNEFPVGKEKQLCCPLLLFVDVVCASDLQAYQKCTNTKALSRTEMSVIALKFLAA